MEAPPSLTHAGSSNAEISMFDYVNGNEMSVTATDGMELTSPPKIASINL